MKRKTKIIIAALLSLVVAIPAFAVFSEKDLSQTLSVLRGELSRDYKKMAGSQENLNARGSAQHGKMIRMMKSCNELSLILYSQSQDYTFDMAYALKAATKEYEEYNSRKMPFDEIVTRLDLEIDRYSRLIESLRRLPPQIKEIDGVPDSLLYHNDSVNFDLPRMARSEMMRPPMPPRPTNGDGDVEIAGMEVTDASEEAVTPMRQKPFMLDEQGLEDRDTCLFYAKALLKMYSDTKDAIIKDNEHYEEANARLKESYDFAQSRYEVIQKRIFSIGQDDYFYVLKSFGKYTKRAFADAKAKYTDPFKVGRKSMKSDWRGIVVLSFLVFMLLYIFIATVISVAIVMVMKKKVKKMQTEEFHRHAPCLTLFCGIVIFAITIMIGLNFIDNMFFIEASKLVLIFAWLIAAILISLLARLRGNQMPAGMRIYAPAMWMGLLVIVFRIVFIPNKMLNLIFPPILLAFFVWQLVACKKNSKKVPTADSVIGWISFAVMAAGTVIAWGGYVLLALQVLVWWVFQLAAIETLITASMILSTYEKRRLSKKIANDAYKMPPLPGITKGQHINVTWFFDLLKNAALPIAAILSFPLSVWMASDVFDLSTFCRTMFFDYFVDLADADGNEVLQISIYNIVLLSTLFYCFRYIDYLIKSIYHKAKVVSLTSKKGNVMLRANEINFTLANNIIGILAWGTYVIMAIILVKIPMGAISIVAAGLATGIGLAMKDILNNFIYGIQLMSGRLRVGDWIECDGTRGKVTSISYQCTQIETIDGAMMSFLNATLFSKNFMNLTRNNSYEFVKIVVGVNYGVDIEKVRTVLLEAMKANQTKDMYGRDIVDLTKGVTVVFDNFADSAVELAVKQFVLVSERNAYIARSKEIIYNALNANGIEIPFPQRDVNLRVINHE